MCSMLEVYLRIRRRRLIFGLQPGPNPMVCVLNQGKLQTEGMDGMQLQMEENGQFMAGRRVMVAGGSRTVSYTHLDVYKRQAQGSPLI